MQLEQWRREGRTWRWRGHEIFYRREGAGETLLLIHGFPTASWDWHRVWPALVRRYDVVALDMLGFGFSAKPRRYAYSIFDQASLHEALLAEWGIGAVHVLAHDYGDTVAQEMLARQIEHGRADGPGLRLRSVCLLNGGIFPGVHRPLAIQRLLASPFGPLVAPLLSKRSLARSFRRIFGPRTQPTGDEIDDFWALIDCNGGRRVIPRLIRYMHEREAHRERWVGALTGSPVPLRLIDGLADPISGGHLVEHYRSVIPRPDVVELPGIGHYPQVEAPDTIVEALVAFHDGRVPIFASVVPCPRDA